MIDDTTVWMLQGLAINIHRLLRNIHCAADIVTDRRHFFIFCQLSYRSQSHNKCCRCCRPIYATKAVKLYKSLSRWCWCCLSAICCRFIELHFPLCTHMHCCLWPTKGHCLRHKNEPRNQKSPYGYIEHMYMYMYVP